MAKFYGEVGYGETVEDPPGSGVHKLVITEHKLYGDVERVSRRRMEDDKVNSDLSVGHVVKVVADPYAREHFFAIQYVRWAGTLWEVREVNLERPRLHLWLGGVYNGPTPAPAPAAPAGPL